MPFMRCVGGASDGREWYVDRGRLDVSVPDPSKLLPIAYTPDAAHPDAITIAHTHYSVRTLRDPDGFEMKYLAPTSWSDGQAIAHQFSKGTAGE